MTLFNIRSILEVLSWISDKSKKFKEFFDEVFCSIILDDFHYTPVVGIVLFNENMKDINPVKLTEDYLTSYMLHHFIRLLGFNAALSEVRFLEILPCDDDEIFYLNT